MAQEIDRELKTILAKYPGQFDSILENRDAYRVQILYSQVDRDKKGRARFTDHSFNLDENFYFYPASTVKLPVAVLALQRLHELGIQGLDRNTTMITGEDGDRQTAVLNDPSAPDGRPTIEHYIKKILLVSDNDAFNRLYEFLGQEYINNTLHRMGYPNVQIIHRLDISLSEEQNRHTNPVWFMDSAGRVIYRKPAERSELEYLPRQQFLGKGYIRGDLLINEPFDFSKKNWLPLQVLHSVIKSILFPKDVPAHQRFNLSQDDYIFLRKYMSMVPAESKWPAYDSGIYHDNYAKFLFYGAEKTRPLNGLRIFNKTGDAYGFLIDGAYIAGFPDKVEFLLSAVIYCNSDGILNDDHYDYESLGLPFMKQLGRAVYEYELQRKKKVIPDLSDFIFTY